MCCKLFGSEVSDGLLSSRVLQGTGGKVVYLWACELYLIHSTLISFVFSEHHDGIEDDREYLSASSHYII